MQRKRLRFGDDFRVAFADARVQAAAMTLAPGAVEGGPDNRHRGADQRLSALSGTGRALVEGRRAGLRDGVRLIEKGGRHAIRNTGRTPLRTLDVHVPPACDARGEPLARGRPGPA